MNSQSQSSSDKKEEERQLIENLKVGSDEAIRQFVRDYRQRIYSFAYSILMNKEDAEDVTQESLMKVVHNIGGFNGDSSLVTWVFRIVRNASVDLKRKQIRGSLSVKAVHSASIDSEVATSSSPAGALQVRQELVLLGKLLKDLSAEHRQILVLREVDGLSYDEIADLLAISRGTVMSRLFYARKKVQESRQVLLEQEEHRGTSQVEEEATSLKVGGV